MRTCQLRLGENPALAGIKHLCRLEQVLAQLELRGHAVQQGRPARHERLRRRRNQQQRVRRARRGAPHPELSFAAASKASCAAPSSKRHARSAFVPRSATSSSAELLAADELFVTNALFGIWPVTELDGRRFAVGPTTAASHGAAGLRP